MTPAAPASIDAFASERIEAKPGAETPTIRSEEHTSELQSRGHLVCRLLLEKKNRSLRRPDGRRQPPRAERTTSSRCRALRGGWSALLRRGSRLYQLAADSGEAWADCGGAHT